MEKEMFKIIIVTAYGSLKFVVLSYAPEFESFQLEHCNSLLYL